MDDARHNPRVTLLDMPEDPVGAIWHGYKVCYTEGDPVELWERRPSQDEMMDFVERYAPTSHASPRTHATFRYAVTGVSRSCLDQLRTHHVGISFDVQSQRWVAYDDVLRVILPESVARLKGCPDGSREREAYERYMEAGQATMVAYGALLDVGVPAEDARYVLPMGMTTTFVVSANFQALLHIADERLCTAAQWEVRRLVSRMRAELVRAAPRLGRLLQPKCGEHRQGCCNEPVGRYERCPLRRIRPHRSDLIRGGSIRQRALNERDLALAEAYIEEPSPGQI